MKPMSHRRIKNPLPQKQKEFRRQLKARHGVVVSIAQARDGRILAVGKNYDAVNRALEQTGEFGGDYEIKDYGVAL